MSDKRTKTGSTQEKGTFLTATLLEKVTLDVVSSTSLTNYRIPLTVSSQANEFVHFPE